MSKKIFISYEFIEKDVARTLPSWFQPNGPCDGEPVYVFDPNAKTTPQIDAAILRVMQTCKVALFLNSENAHSKYWIDQEAEMAGSLNLPIVVLPLKNSPAGLPPHLRSRRNIQIVDDWSPARLCPILNAIQVRSST